MSKKSKRTEEEETTAVPVFQPFVLPTTGIMSLRKLADYIGVEKVKDLVAVLPDGAVIIKMGKLSHSLIDLEELRKNYMAVGVMRQPIVVPVPAPVAPQPPQTQLDEEDDE